MTEKTPPEVAHDGTACGGVQYRTYRETVVADQEFEAVDGHGNRPIDFSSRCQGRFSGGPVA